MKQKSLFTILLILILLVSFGQEKTRSKSAKTGKFVSKKYADKNKSTTYTYKVKKNRK